MQVSPFKYNQRWWLKVKGQDIAKTNARKIGLTTWKEFEIAREIIIEKITKKWYWGKWDN